MKIRFNPALVALFFITLGSCKKENGENIIPIANPSEGTYEIIVYKQDQQVVLTRKGDARFTNSADYGSQIILSDPDFMQGIAITPNDVFAAVFLQANRVIGSPVSLSPVNFDANMEQRWYSLDNDWHYRSISGVLKIKEVAPRIMKGEFIVTLTKQEYANPKWGDTITIKGKFYAICDGYHC